MFKKLKQKINEEQSPQRNAQTPQQAQMGSGQRRSSQTNLFYHDGVPSPSDRERSPFDDTDKTEALAGMIAEPAFLSEYTIFALDHSKRPKTAQVASVSSSKGPTRSPGGSVNGDGSISPQREEPQSFAQKLQLKVPSMESIIRGGASRAEQLFRSPSKESLARSSSRESLTHYGENEAAGVPAYDPPSDIESEAEEASSNAESLSKEQLVHRLIRVEASLAKYRGKYSEIVTAYRTVQRDKEKTQAILSQCQDKSLRRIGELREELQMDQQAKKHLQDEFDAALEEKDQMITVLQTQVGLLKKRVKGISDGALVVEGDQPISDVPESESTGSSNDQEVESEVHEEGVSDPAKLLEALQKRVRRQENLLHKCKEMIRIHKDRSTHIATENETLQEQLQERLQELERIKELHTTEKTKLINQLRDVKNQNEQLEQDKGMVIAETKRQMHETLEMKEEEIAQLRSRLQLANTQNEELQDQKEKAEKSAFEELERALGSAHRADEARKQLQVQMEEKMNEAERVNEEERKSLQQELTRVKQEVVTIMKKSSEERVANLQKSHSEALAAKEEEIISRINKAVELCKEEFAQLTNEKEHQAALALEDAELQKTALIADGENRVKDMQQDLEVAKTRIMELESSHEKISQDRSLLSLEQSNLLGQMKDNHKEQMSRLEEDHQAQLEKHKDALTQQHNAALEELKEKQRAELETLLQQKDLQVNMHTEEINQKLNAKQAEQEALSFELSEVLKSKQLLEKKLDEVQDVHRLALQDQVAKHSAELENIKLEHERSLGGMEKSLKEELNALKIIIREKEKAMKEVSEGEKRLREESHANLEELGIKAKQLEDLQQSLSNLQTENSNLKAANEASEKISSDLVQSKNDLIDLQHQLEVAKTDIQQKELLLQDLEQQLQQSKTTLCEQEKSHSDDFNTMKEEITHLQKQLEDDKAAHEKKLNNTLTEMEAKLKTQETKMEKLKQKAKEMQDHFKKKMQQKEESMKTALAKKDAELQEKEQEVQGKILEMAQRNSQGLSDTMSELQANHLGEMEKLRDNHKHELLELERQLQEKLGQQEEELMEKHSHILQEKVQELQDCSLNLNRSKEHNEQLLTAMKDLREEFAIQETTVQKLKEELREAGVKLEDLSTSDTLLREQLKSVENARDSLQEKLNMTEEDNREKLRTLSDNLDDKEKQLRALESSRQKDWEDLQNKSEEADAQRKALEAQFQQQIILFSNQMEQYCKDVQYKLLDRTSEVCENVELRVSDLKDRLLCSQKNILHLKNVVANKVDIVCTLEENLRQKSEENNNLCISLEQVTAQVNAHMEQIKALTIQNENNSLSGSEKDLKIEELSELNRVISTKLKENEFQVSDLESIISNLKRQLEDKEKAILELKQQQEEEKQKTLDQMEETFQRLKEERESTTEQANALRASLSENDNTVASLKGRLEELERTVSEKNEALQRLTVNFDNQSISKSEMDQVLSEKEQKVNRLTAELDNANLQLCELQEQLALKVKEWEQLACNLKQQENIRENERREFVEKLQQNGHFEQEMVNKLHNLEEDNHKCKSQLQSQEAEFERLKDEMIKSKEECVKETEERLTAESTRKISDLKKKAEQKISQIRKQLTAQLDEKNDVIKTLEASHEQLKKNDTSNKECIDTLEKKNKSLEEILVKLKQEQAQQLEQTQADEKMMMEKSLEEQRSMYEEKLSALQRDSLHQTELQQGEALEIEVKLKEAEKHNHELLEEVNTLKEEIRQKSVECDQHQAALMQAQVVFETDKNIESNTLQQTKSMLENENHSADPDDDSFDSLKSKLNQMKNDKEKIQKDFNRLQKDIRLMRKEHDQELEYAKKQLIEESELKHKLELEDIELKHNSEIKQLMREFNTQIAVKEKEIDTAVKETIGKAQVVEAELLSSHRKETTQLKKVIAEREDELNRTVGKYEQVIQSREEEMGTRVWQVQKELEELQARSHNTLEMSPEELQVQLAEKTTLLSEARLKEQGFVEKIHSLEDKIKCFHRNTVVTHLGSTYKDAALHKSEPLSEATELEYLKKVLFEYMMGRETKTMAKVITSMLKFPPDQAQKVLDKEESKAMHWLSV
ncbi:golgin subfamily A member 4 isoform X2 [Corythoichthys intestinalis]|uniref:golgin subfamily A member 4 isoform X2 n=1 Tax=Corythoichthys intestinalis TaxID=161448 RepID=UPI0025A5BAC2|nr:golgin subfamily A member 4 isoform X2 [Corythoichthys intestinalis]